MASLKAETSKYPLLSRVFVVSIKTCRISPKPQQSLPEETHLGHLRPRCGQTPCGSQRVSPMPLVAPQGCAPRRFTRDSQIPPLLNLKMPSQLLRVLKAHSHSALAWEPSHLSSWRSVARDLTSLRRTTFTAPRFHSCRAHVSVSALKQLLWTQLLRVHLQQLFNQDAPCLSLQRLPPILASP